MKSAWQKALLGFAVLTGMSAQAADGSQLIAQLPIQTTSSSLQMEPSSKKWSGKWSLGTELQEYSEGKDEGTGAMMAIGTQFQYRVAPWAHFFLDGDARFYASRVQTRYEGDEMSSGVKVREGYIAFQPLEPIEIRSGILSQKDIKMPLLINSRRAFPGVREQWRWKQEHFEVFAWAQQTVPTSSSLNTQRAEREATPTFLTETIAFKIAPAKVFEAEFNATHFRFNNLPAVVAFESSTLGNSANGDVAANSDFKYGFEGFAVGGDLCACLDGPISFKAGGKWLQNTAAPTQSNRGQLIYLESTLRTSQLNITPRYSLFFNESDSSPAYYNRWQWGNNNRQGSVMQLEVEFPKYEFKIQAEFVQAKMINQDPFQFDKQVFILGVETNHVSF